MLNDENEISDLVNITTLNGDNIITILMNEDEYSKDYVECWKERIKEEIRTRIETGVITPIRYLKWYVRGVGWESLDPDVEFTKFLQKRGSP